MYQRAFRNLVGLVFSISPRSLKLAENLHNIIMKMDPSIPPARLGCATYFRREFSSRQIKIIKKGSLLATIEFNSTVASWLLF